MFLLDSVLKDSRRPGRLHGGGGSVADIAYRKEIPRVLARWIAAVLQVTCPQADVSSSRFVTGNITFLTRSARMVTKTCRQRLHPHACCKSASASLLTRCCSNCGVPSGRVLPVAMRFPNGLIAARRVLDGWHKKRLLPEDVVRPWLHHLVRFRPWQG